MMLNNIFIKNGPQFAISFEGTDCYLVQKLNTCNHNALLCFGLFGPINFTYIQQD